jgi:hypothetical protein
VTEKVLSADQNKILFFEPENLFLFLDQLAAQELSRGERVKRYRVKVQCQAVPEAERKKKREVVTHVIV